MRFTWKSLQEDDWIHENGLHSIYLDEHTHVHNVVLEDAELVTPTSVTFPLPSPGSALLGLVPFNHSIQLFSVVGSDVTAPPAESRKLSGA